MIMAALRQAVIRSRTSIILCSPQLSHTSLSFSPHTPQARFKSKKSKSEAPSTDTLVPRSQQILADGDALQAYHAAEEKMKAAVEWYRKECAALEVRASGRVTPSLLAPVRVHLPEHEKGETVRLEEVATVGVRDGSMLWIVVFQEQNLKHIEAAIWDAKIPSVAPQRVDVRTIKIPIPRPTVDVRTALYTSAHRQSEDIRVQVRKIHAASSKKGNYGKYSAANSAFQALSNKWTHEVDNILMNLKKATGASK